MTHSNHQKFLKHLDASKETVWMVAKWLVGKGHTVTLPPTTQAPTAADWKSHADGGDLFTSNRIEVKHSSRNFTCREDWPYPNFIVCGKKAWDRATQKPRVFFYVSADRTHIATLPCSTFKRWTVETVRDRRYENYVQEVYMAPLECVKFSKFKL